MSTQKIQSVRKKEASVSRNHLTGKVVLLIGNDTAVLQSLTLQLAQKGADIALVCRHISQETARLIKEKVNALGRRFLFVKENELEKESSQRPAKAQNLIQTVVSDLGHLDIFIDLSAQKSEAKADDFSSKPEQLAPSWQLRQAILEKLYESA